MFFMQLVSNQLHCLVYIFNSNCDHKLWFFQSLNGYHDNICSIIIDSRPRAWVTFRVHKNLLLFFQNHNIYLDNFLSMVFKQTYRSNKFHVARFSVIGNQVVENWKLSGWKPKIWNHRFECGSFFSFCLSVRMAKFMATTKVEMDIHETQHSMG
jgi:hypothetical protein